MQNSGVGARGLMQLMPETAALIEPNYDEDDLYDVNGNIRIASKYLDSLIKEYNGNFVYVLSIIMQVLNH